MSKTNFLINLCVSFKNSSFSCTGIIVEIKQWNVSTVS